MADRERGTALTVIAVLFGLLAVSNLLKGFRLGGDQTGFVFLGDRLTGMPNAVLGAAFGIYLLAYAWGIWTLRTWALPMGIAYLLYVIVNLVMFQVRGPKPPGAGVGFMIFGLVYAAVAIGVPAYAIHLLKNQELH